MIVLMVIADLVFEEAASPIFHPVIMIGKMIDRGEKLLFPARRAPVREFIAGSLLVTAVGVTVYTGTRILLVVASKVSPWLGWLATVYLGYTCLAAAGLARAATEVIFALEREGLPAARQHLALIVGRETDNLDREEIIRAVLETVAENLSDGVVAPLLYLFLGGVPLAMLYKAVNTMDSMLGYRNERYEFFGRPAARLDDLANLVPARLTALLIIAAGWLQGGDVKSAWQVLWRDRKRHASPNSGWPEAALAGVLGIRLGGPAIYCGRPVAREFLGDPRQPLYGSLVTRAVAILYLATWMLVFAGILCR